MSDDFTDSNFRLVYKISKGNLVIDVKGIILRFLFNCGHYRHPEKDSSVHSTITPSFLMMSNIPNIHRLSLSNALFLS